MSNEEAHFATSSAIFRDWITRIPVQRSREELRSVLESRRRGIQVIMADTLLLQLQYGAFAGKNIVDAIMQFDDNSISKALRTLYVEQGLK